jgi:hypothetical protein
VTPAPTLVPAPALDDPEPESPPEGGDQPGPRRNPKRTGRG